MAAQPDWIELPFTLGIATLAELAPAFVRVGVEHRSEPLHKSSKLPLLEHAVFVRADQVETAVIVLREFFQITDPLQDEPFSGDCPACGAAVVEARECASCGLNFTTPGDPQDPVLLFLREHGAFREFE